jgi:hypothetical protein
MIVIIIELELEEQLFPFSKDATITFVTGFYSCPCFCGVQQRG